MFDGVRASLVPPQECEDGSNYILPIYKPVVKVPSQENGGRQLSWGKRGERKKNLLMNGFSAFLN
jgi:hypothetical protein